MEQHGACADAVIICCGHHRKNKDPVGDLHQKRQEEKWSSGQEWRKGHIICAFELCIKIL